MKHKALLCLAISAFLLSLAIPLFSAGAAERVVEVKIPGCRK